MFKEKFHKFMDSHGYVVYVIVLCLLSFSKYVTMDGQILSLGVLYFSLFSTSVILWLVVKFLSSL